MSSVPVEPDAVNSVARGRWAGEAVAVATVQIDGWPVEYELAGDGPPVVFVHASPFVSWYRPLLQELGDWTTLLYRRPASHRPRLSIDDDADLLAGLVSHLALERPHVVGHSYGGLVAMAVATRRRVEITSLALLEPATMGLLDPVVARQRGAALLELARSQGTAIAMQAFLQAVCGAAGRERLDEVVPGATAEAVANAKGFFSTEMPAVLDWRFGPADAAAIQVPILNISGTESEPRFAESAAIIRSYFRDAKQAEVPATHLMMAQAPREIASHLESFWRQASAGSA
jgi:pimeloyl-ACP methyl ester carboxylesterase